MVINMYSFILNVEDVDSTEIFSDYAAAPEVETETEMGTEQQDQADPVLDPEIVSDTEEETEVVFYAADDGGAASEASLSEVCIQLQVSNRLLGNLLTLQIFLLAFIIFWFFYKFIKNNITNHIM